MTPIGIITTMLVGTMADRPDPSRQLMLYLDVDTNVPYWCDGTDWHAIGGGGGGYSGVTGDGLTPGGLNVAGGAVFGGVVDALKVNGAVSYALVSNFAGQTVPTGSAALLPFDFIGALSTDFTLSSDQTQIHFGPGAYIVTVDAYAASAALASGFLSVQSVLGSSALGAISINQAGTVPAALSGFGPVGLGFIATANADNWVSLQAYQTDSVDRSIAGDLLIVRLGKA